MKDGIAPHVNHFGLIPKLVQTKFVLIAEDQFKRQVKNHTFLKQISMLKTY